MRLSLLLSLCISEKKVDGPGCNVAFEICWLRIRVTRITHLYSFKEAVTFMFESFVDLF